MGLLAAGAMVGLSFAQPVEAADVPEPLLPGVATEMAPVPDTLPAPPMDDQPPVVVALTQDSAGNLDVSVRVLSPGDDEPTTLGDSASGLVSATAAGDITDDPTAAALEPEGTNTNVSVRVLSPGNDELVLQSGAAPAPEVAPAASGTTPPSADALSPAADSTVQGVERGPPNPSTDSEQYQDSDSQYQSDPQFGDDPWYWAWNLSTDCVNETTSASTETGNQSSRDWVWEWAWEWTCDGAGRSDITAQPSTPAEEKPSQVASGSEPAGGLWDWSWSFTHCGTTTAFSTETRTSAPLDWAWDWSWNWSCPGAGVDGAGPPLPVALAPPPGAVAAIPRLPALVPGLPIAAPELPSTATIEALVPLTAIAVVVPESPAFFPIPAGVGVTSAAEIRVPAAPPFLTPTAASGAPWGGGTLSQPTTGHVWQPPRSNASGPHAPQATRPKAHKAPPRRAHRGLPPLDLPRRLSVVGSGASGGAVPSALLFGIAALTGFVVLAAPGSGRRIRLARELSPRSRYRAPLDHPG